MKLAITRAAIVSAAMLAIAGCTDATFEDVSPKAERQVPEKLVEAMKAKGMTRSSPIMVRIFKEEGKLEVWKRKDNGRFDMVTDYNICKWSGKLGPKFTEGDRQAPEGFYTIRPGQMNPKSSYYLSFDLGFPNSYDRANGRSGMNLMVHGACSSSGCYSMTDEQVGQIYALARDAFRGGQSEFQLEAFPFRMTAGNMARYRDDQNYKFWTMLKEGYDHFEITKVPPKVDVCEKKYVFNMETETGTPFSATAACPTATQPESLRSAYQSFESTYSKAFSAALAAETPPPAPKPTIAGYKEAVLVSDWSKRRARGEKVTREPPSLRNAALESAIPVTAPVPTPSPKAAEPDPAQADAAPPASDGTAEIQAQVEAPKRKWWKIIY